MPDFIDGVATIRGAAVPVVRLAELLGESGGAARRLVVTKVGSRRVALAVDTIVGIRDIGPDMLTALPPLLHNADTEAVERLGSLDGEFLMVLQAAHVIADDVLDAIDQAASA
jgi:chemotaxis signal transduction protein